MTQAALTQSNIDRVVAVEVGSAERWQQAIAQLPNPHPLQSWAWGELKSRWGWQMRPTVWQVDGEPVAAAMLLQRALGPTGFSMLYAPKGPLVDWHDPLLRRIVLERLTDIGRHEHAVFVKIDPDVVRATGIEAEILPHGEKIVRELHSMGWRFSQEQIQFRNTVSLDLTVDEDEILRAMKQKTRYNIRLATRRDVTVRSGSPRDFSLILKMYTSTGERNDFALRPPGYYLDAWQTLWRAGMLQIFVAEYEQKPLAAVLLVHNAHSCLYMYGASFDEERNRMPTYLLQWHAIRWAKQHGCRRYDFWGAPDEFNEEDRMWGVWRFKSGFNGTIERQIGAWDYPVYPRLYKLLIEALPRYRNWLRRR